MKNEAAQQTLAVRLLAGALARRWEGPVFGAGCASCRVSLVINYHIPGPRIARGVGEGIQQNFISACTRWEAGETLFGSK